MSAGLFALGALPFIVLGTLHGLYTVLDEITPQRLAPKDPSVVSAMRLSPLGLTSATTMWRAWIGFNLSHSVGAVGFGLLYLYLALAFPTFLEEAIALRFAAPVIATLYLFMAMRYWFAVPAIGAGAGAACFWIAAVL